MKEVKHGYWAFGIPPYCSVCGADAPLSEQDNEGHRTWNCPPVCPSCGAIMDGSKRTSRLLHAPL